MKARGSYPRDISLVAIVFLIIIFAVAVIHFYISIQLRNEYIKNERERINTIGALFVDNLHRNRADPALLTGQFREYVDAFRIEQIAITDSLGNTILNSRVLPVHLGGAAIDYGKLFRIRPAPGNYVQEGNHLLYRSQDREYFLYLEYESPFAALDRLFKWHIFYITVVLLFLFFLGIFLIRNLLLPMRYVARLAQQLGVPVRKEDFVTETFREVFSKLRSREKTLVEFSAYIAHEFRNSLATITGLARLAGRGKNKTDEIIRECRAMDELIATILDYSKPLQPDFAPVDLTRLLDDVLGRIEIPAGVAVDKKAARSCVVKGDYEMLAMAVRNLIKNGYESIAGKGTVTITVNRDEDYCRLAVADTGAGIDEKDRDRVFSPFFSRKEGGTGLGLASARKVIELHGGRIEVESEKGKGTAFIVRLPFP